MKNENIMHLGNGISKSPQNFQGKDLVTLLFIDSIIHLAFSIFLENWKQL